MLTITDQQLIFDMCSAISKHYAWAVHPTILQDLIHKHRKDHDIVFNFWDGEHVLLSGALELIKETQRIFNIPKEKILIRSYFDIDVDFALSERSNPKMFLSKGSLFLQPINNNSFDKKFLSLSGRIDIFRLRLAKHLHTNWAEDTILSFKPNLLTVQHYFRNGSEKFYQDEISWATEYAPIKFDTVQQSWQSGSVDYNESMLNVASYYQRYFLEIVAETDSKNPYWITEKTVRPLAFGKPFILFSGQHALQYLRDIGFQTFSPWIDESYDAIENPFDRFDAVLKEIDRIAALSYDQLRVMATELHEVLVHNQYHLLKTV